MDSAIAGAVGAVAGAILGGGGKILQDHLSHRLASRTAARILVVSLRSMHADMNSALGRGKLTTRPMRWQRDIHVWERHQEALARVVGADDYEIVAFAFWRAELVQASLPIAESLEDEALVDLPVEVRGIFEASRTACLNALEVVDKVRYSALEKTRGLADADRAPPLGKAVPDAAGTPESHGSE